jgi:thioredoxin 1
MKAPLKILIVVAVAGLVVTAVALKNRQAPATPTATAAGTALAATTPAAVTQKLPKLLDLGATKCIPCKKMAPILEELKKEYAGKLEVQFIDVWQNPDAAKQHGIEMIPTQIFYDADGKELFRHVGFFGRDDILSKWKELGFSLKAN